MSEGSESVSIEGLSDTAIAELRNEIEIHKEEVVALQMLLNAVFTTSLKVDGVVGKATADAIKAAQAAAALPEDGVAGPKTKAALLLARAALSAAPQADERYTEVVQRLLVAAKAQPVRWTLRRDDEPGEGLDEWMDAAQAELERAFGAWSKACRPSSSIDPGAGSSTDPLPAPALESLPTISFEYTAEEADAHILLSFAELATAHEARDGPGGKLAQTTVRADRTRPPPLDRAGRATRSLSRLAQSSTI